MLVRQPAVRCSRTSAVPRQGATRSAGLRDEFGLVYASFLARHYVFRCSGPFASPTFSGGSARGPNLPSPTSGGSVRNVRRGGCGRAAPPSFSWRVPGLARPCSRLRRTGAPGSVTAGEARARGCPTSIAARLSRQARRSAGPAPPHCHARRLLNVGDRVIRDGLLAGLRDRERYPQVVGQRRAHVDRRPRSPGGRTPAARRAGTGAPGRSGPDVPYCGSPHTGWPIAAMWTRIWWVRPVSRMTLSSAAVGSRRSISKWVRAARGIVGVDRHQHADRAGRGRSGRRSSLSGPTDGRRPVPRTRDAAGAAPAATSERGGPRRSWRPRADPEVSRSSRWTIPARQRLLAAGGPALERLGKRPGPVPARGMHDDPGGLVDHQQVLVLVGDGERRRRRRTDLRPELAASST